MGEASSYRKRAPLTSANVQVTNEVIQFAGFLSDYDPSLIFALTYDADRQVSYLKVLKIHRRDEHDRSYSFAEAADK